MIVEEETKGQEIEEIEKVDEELLDDSSYTDAAKYWDKIPATVDGMLGGFGHISHTDITGSQSFLKSLFIKVINSPLPFN